MLKVNTAQFWGNFLHTLRVKKKTQTNKAKHGIKWGESKEIGVGVISIVGYGVERIQFNSVICRCKVLWTQWWVNEQISALVWWDIKKGSFWFNESFDFTSFSLFLNQSSMSSNVFSLSSDIWDDGTPSHASKFTKMNIINLM